MTLPNVLPHLCYFMACSSPITTHLDISTSRTEIATFWLIEAVGKIFLPKYHFKFECYQFEHKMSWFGGNVPVWAVIYESCNNEIWKILTRCRKYDIFRIPPKSTLFIILKLFWNQSIFVYLFGILILTYWESLYPELICKDTKNVNL